MYKLVVFAMVIAANTASPLSTFPVFRKPIPAPKYKPIPIVPKPQTYAQAQYPIIPIIRSVSDISPDGNHYSYSYETGNGISAQEQGDLVGSGPDAGIAAQGSFQYTSPEGIPVVIQYVADQNGFQPSGNVLPTPPPTPEAILRALKYNEAHPEVTSLVGQRKYF